MSFPTPEAQGGQSPVNVACSPESGATFPVGQTTVRCTATDALSRTAACEFRVTVPKLAQVSKLRYMAFGDSITAGEVRSRDRRRADQRQARGRARRRPIRRCSQRCCGRATSSRATRSPSRTRALGGEKAVEARNRFFAALNAVRPDVVLLLHGHNDIPSGADGAASTAASEIRIMAAEAKIRGARVFLGTPVPGASGGNRTIRRCCSLTTPIACAPGLAGRRRAGRLLHGDAARRVPLHRRRRPASERSRLRPHRGVCSSRPSRRISKCDRLVGAWPPICSSPIA